MRERGNAFILAFAILSFATPMIAGDDALLTATYRRLDAARDRKHTELISYLQRVRRLADSILADQTMTEFFRLKREYFLARQRGDVPQELQRAIELLKIRIRKHYLRHYMSFYDILCINTNGDIFYTVRMEKDHHQNLFQGQLAKTALAKQLRAGGEQTVVDYQYYVVSEEPSAFFVEPFREDGELLGWFVLQCTVNKINSMFAHDDTLGRTGEAFLVNREQYMLTDSRFFGDSTILRRHLSPENIEAKFREGKGHRIVTDYRGRRAITSFATCPFGENRWLVIAKIDEDEIITEAYQQRRDTLGTALLQHFQEQENPGHACEPFDGSFRRVDMDEFRKANQGESLGTFGVSTCTAAVIAYPGRFAYMAHISNYDRVYGARGTDLISHVLKRIRDFDLPRAKIRNLRVTLVAPHLNSIVKAIDLLVENGLLLSQIRFLYRKEAAYAGVYRTAGKGPVVAHWKLHRDQAQPAVVEDSSQTRNMAEIVKRLIHDLGKADVTAQEN